MTESSATPPLLPPDPPPAPEQTLRKLFLTLFLRGRSSRGLRREKTPKSVGSKLALTLAFYALFGMFALLLAQQPVFTLSLYLHGMTFVFLGMFVAASAGEVLFNKEEADILLHRPVTARALLVAKIMVLVQVSLWLAGAFNLTGFFTGLKAPDSHWFFPLAHAISTALEALFCTGCVILTYQLCLRWFGRERLEGLMTTVQVFVAVGAVLAGQIFPRLIGRFGGNIHFNTTSWWIALLPPAWFAGFDDAIAGSNISGSWLLAVLGLLATATVLWLAFGKLARDYQSGLQTINETVSRPRTSRRTDGRRWCDVLVNAPPLRWWMRDSVERAGFLLTAAYLMRDRDVKLRIYPSMTSMLVMPVILLVQEHGPHSSGFGLAFSGAYLGLIPMLGLNLLQYSQQWQAADLFRVAPIHGPAPLCHGARRAVLCFLTLPVLLLFALTAWLMRNDTSRLLLALPGLVALPLYALVPCLGGKGVPLSLPTEEAKSAGRGLNMLAVMMISLALSFLGNWAWLHGWFQWMLASETILVAGAYLALRARVNSARWRSME